MRSSRLAGLGLAAALVVGGTVFGPAVSAPAQAAGVAPAVVTAAKSKPKFKKNLPKYRVVKVNGRTTLRVKASGGSISYQWYYANHNDWFYSKVKGKAGKRSYLKVKATIGKSGGQYMVIIKNRKGTKRSRPTTILVKNTASRPFASNKRGYTAHWSFNPVTYSANQYNGKTLMKAILLPRNETSKTRNPNKGITIYYRDKKGKIWRDKNAYGTYLKAIQGWNSPGIKKVGSAKRGSVPKKVAYAAVLVPTSRSKGGTWIIYDSASPKMKLYFKQG